MVPSLAALPGHCVDLLVCAWPDAIVVSSGPGTVSVTILSR